MSDCGILMSDSVDDSVNGDIIISLKREEYGRKTQQLATTTGPAIQPAPPESWNEKKQIFCENLELKIT
jgi:hypothetical protein